MKVPLAPGTIGFGTAVITDGLKPALGMITAWVKLKGVPTRLVLFVTLKTTWRFGKGATQVTLVVTVAQAQRGRVTQCISSQISCSVPV